MASIRRPRASPKQSIAVAQDDPRDAGPELPPELVAANRRAEAALVRRLEAPNDPVVQREHEAAKRVAERLGEAWIAAITEAFRRKHGGRTAVARDTFAPAKNITTKRQRPSQRETPGRDERERIACRIGADPDMEHARAADGHRTRLESLRASWPHIKAMRKMLLALDTLRASVSAMSVVSGAARAGAMAHIDALDMWAERVAPSYFRSPEEVWLPLASEDLDDDEIARILYPEPAGYARDRDAAMLKVRKMRSKLERRAAGASPSMRVTSFTASNGETIGGSAQRKPSAFQQRRRLREHRARRQWHDGDIRLERGDQ